jgi:ATP dependent DNA ligase C terminal region
LAAWANDVKAEASSLAAPGAAVWSTEGWFTFGVGQRLADVLKGNGLVRATSPFSERIPERRVTWLEPKLIAEVSYAEIMHGDALRAALFRGFV